MGEIIYFKGSNILREIITCIEEEHQSIRIVVIGTLDREIDYRKLIVTGRYRKEAIEGYIEDYSVDIVFIPSICPETFSYTTEEAIKMGIPVAVFDLGAQAERVKRYNKGLVISQINAKVALKEIAEFARACNT
jgi:glycosyltransferase involved in cell wall biosynthesis